MRFDRLTRFEVHRLTLCSVKCKACGIACVGTHHQTCDCVDRMSDGREVARSLPPCSGVFGPARFALDAAREAHREGAKVVAYWRCKGAVWPEIAA